MIATIVRMLAACAVLAGALIAAAAPASAEQMVLQGDYSYQLDGGTSGVMTIYPSCVPTVGDLREPLYLPVACHLQISPKSGDAIRGGDARQTNGVWAYTTARGNLITCPDGTKATGTETTTLNTDTGTGTRKIFHNEVCGLQPGMFTTNFTFAYQGPLAIPVEQYPLVCEPGGLRRCW